MHYKMIKKMLKAKSEPKKVTLNYTVAVKQM